MDLVNERERIEREGRDRIQQLNEENEKLRQQIILYEELKKKQELESKGEYGHDHLESKGGLGSFTDRGESLKAGSNGKSDRKLDSGKNRNWRIGRWVVC